MSFLNAEWRKLALVNYAVSPDLLMPYVPYGTELDTWNDTHYISLVGFRFVNTRLLGFSVPFHTHFEEVNLRFYVRHKAAEGWRRGVVFIKEIVPKRALSIVANTVYREHYITCPMSHHWQNTGSGLSVAYSWFQKGQQHMIYVEGEPHSQPIEAGSETEFITEHYWGYTQVGKNKTYEYQVTHPRWECYPVKNWNIQVAYAKAYGDTFSELSTMEPLSVMLAEGSEITVEKRRRI